MTAKEYLSQAYRLDQRIDSNIAEITRLREMACGISSPSWEEKVQTSRNTDAPFVRCLEKIMDLEKVVNSEIDTLVDLKRQIRTTVDTVCLGGEDYEKAEEIHADTVHGENLPLRC